MITKVDANLYRGPRPTPETLKDIILLGVKTIIDLESGLYEKLHNDSYKNFDFAAHGIKDLDLPCSDITPPKKEVIDEVIRVVLAEGPVYLHCLAGKDRTGFVAAAYQMMVNKLSFAAAVKEMWSLGFHFWYFWWMTSLSKYQVKK